MKTYSLFLALFAAIIGTYTAIVGELQLSVLLWILATLWKIEAQLK